MGNKGNIKSQKDIVTREVIVNWNGGIYVTIYGRDSYGWFISITNMNICIRSGMPNDITTNANRLSDPMNGVLHAYVVSQAINDDWKEHTQESGLLPSDIGELPFGSKIEVVFLTRIQKKKPKDIVALYLEI